MARDPSMALQAARTLAQPYMVYARSLKPSPEPRAPSPTQSSPSGCPIRSGLPGPSDLVVGAGGLRWELGGCGGGLWGCGRFPSDSGWFPSGRGWIPAPPRGPPGIPAPTMAPTRLPPSLPFPSLPFPTVSPNPTPVGPPDGPRVPLPGTGDAHIPGMRWDGDMGHEMCDTGWGQDGMKALLKGQGMRMAPHACSEHREGPLCPPSYKDWSLHPPRVGKPHCAPKATGKCSATSVPCYGNVGLGWGCLPHIPPFQAAP